MLLATQEPQHSFPLLKPCKSTRKHSAIFISQLAKPFRLVVLKPPKICKLETMVYIPAFSLFLPILKASQICVLLGCQFPLAIDLVVMKGALVVITVIPPIVSVAFLYSIDESALEKGSVTVDLPCLPVWKVVLPSSFVEDLIG